MYIKKVKKNNGKSKKSYEYLHLVESVRTLKGPRQKLILNLGTIDLEPEHYKAVALRIENILKGQKTLKSILPPDEKDPVLEKIESIAHSAATAIILKREKQKEVSRETEFRNVDVSSLEVSNCKTIGAEKVVDSVWKKLELDSFFLKQKGVTKNSLSLFKGLVFSRMICPGSEVETKKWADERSAIYELTGTPVSSSLNSYYRAGDLLYSLKEELERYLCKKEESLFGSSKIILYDLTNTYLEGRALKNKSAKHGRSKEKRSDCPLLTLGLVTDSRGFVKLSRFFEGNQSEPKTLKSIIEELDLSSSDHPQLIKEPKTIVMDAGIASSDNLNLLSSMGLNYVVVHRGKAPFEINFDDMEIVREDPKEGRKVEIKKSIVGGESFILCRSEKKRLKDESIRNKQEVNFLEKVDFYNKNLQKKSSIKKRDSILIKVTHLKQKYPKASSLYDIDIICKEVNSKKTEIVEEIRVSKKEQSYKERLVKDGTYFLRTNRLDLSSKEVFEIYVSLNRIEDSFRAMKSHLGFRPIFHQKEERCNAHLFISVIGYHLMNIILHELRNCGICSNWNSIRNILSNHVRVTNSYIVKSESGEILKEHIRLNSNLEPQQAKIFQALGIKS